MIYDEKNVSEELETYFEKKEDFIKFTKKIIKFYDNLEKKNFQDIKFHIDTKMIDENYSCVDFKFEYKRDLTIEEINKEKEKIEKENVNKKIRDELFGKLSNNSIGSIIGNEDLKKLYLDGKIIL